VLARLQRESASRPSSSPPLARLVPLPGHAYARSWSCGSAQLGRVPSFAFQLPACGGEPPLTNFLARCAAARAAVPATRLNSCALGG
jgi:hypothetical protein